MTSVPQAFTWDPKEKQDGASCVFLAEGGERLLLYPLSVWSVGDCCLSLPQLPGSLIAER